MTKKTRFCVLALAMLCFAPILTLQADPSNSFEEDDETHLEETDDTGGGQDRYSAEDYDDDIRDAYMRESGDGWAFDSRESASQAFESECAPAYYENLANYVQYYAEDPLNENYKRTIKNQEENCRRDIIKEDQRLHDSLNAQLRLGDLTLAGLQAVFASSSVTIYQESPKVAHAMGDFLTELEHYQRSCRDGLCQGEVRMMRNIVGNNKNSYWEALSGGCFSSTFFVDGLERLSANSCSGQRKKLQAFVEGNVFSYLAGLLEHCSSPEGSGCVADLRILAGLNRDKESRDPQSLFEFCSIEQRTARECCNNPEAEACDGSVNQYRAQLQNANAQGQAQCGAKGSQNFHNIQARAEVMIRGTCESATKECEENCESLVADFKERFLTCFVAPDFQESAFLHHKDGGNCRVHIKAIKEAYNDRAVDHNQRYNLALDRDQNGMTVACNKPFDEMRDNLQARSSALAESLCNSEATQETAQTAQDSQAPSVLSSPRSRDFGSSPPSTRNIVRHPAQADSLGPQEEEPVTRPGHIRVPGISHPVMEKAHYLENWAPDMGLEEEDLVYREGYSMPLMRDEAEEKDRAEANKGRDGYNRWGNKINPDLEPCPGPICDKHARFVPRAESAPSQQEEEEPSGPLEKVAGKTGDFVDRLKGAGGIAGAVAGGLDRFVDAWDRKEREAIRGTKRALRRVLGIRPGPKPPANKLTDAQKVLYEEFKNLMENAPKADSLEEAMDKAAEEERRLLEWACMDLTGKTCAQMNRDAEAEMGFKLPDEAR